MSKFNITVEIDYIDEDGNLDDVVCEQIVNAVVSKVSDTVTGQIQERAQNIFKERLQTMEASISDKLNKMMEEFFSTPKDVTDRWGDIKRRGVTVKQLLNEACDKFMEQPLNEHGEPASGYNVKYKSRVDYSINHDMEYAIKRAVGDVTDNLKKKISNEITKQMGEKLAGVVGLDDLLKK